MLIWDGACIVHERFSAQQLVKLQTRHPAAKVIAHPECPADVLTYADHIGSTSSLINYVKTSVADAFIVATEPGIIHQMRLIAPGKTFLTAPGMDGDCNCHDCPYMKMNTLEKVYLCMRDASPQITLPESLRLAAIKPLQRMLEMSPLPQVSLKPAA
jgi:quinolinate synthase